MHICVLLILKVTSNFVQETRKMVPIIKRARSFPFFFHPAWPSFHLHFLVDERKFLVWTFLK